MTLKFQINMHLILILVTGISALLGLGYIYSEANDQVSAPALAADENVHADEFPLHPVAISNAAMKPCLITLSADSSKSITLTGKSTLTATGCAIHSNSRLPGAISVSKDASIFAPEIVSVGEIKAPAGSLLAGTIKGASEILDPFQEYDLPSSGKCDFRNITFKKGKNILKPGTYCGGIIAIGAVDIVLEPGTYRLKSGSLILGGSAVLTGENVAIVFDGIDSVFGFGPSTKVDLTAPADGPLTGILFYQNRNSALNQEFILRSNRAGRLEGAIYLPRAKLFLDNVSRVGHRSKWMIIVAKEIELENGAQLIIGYDFANSEIPLPLEM